MSTLIFSQLPNTNQKCPQTRSTVQGQVRAECYRLRNIACPFVCYLAADVQKYQGFTIDNGGYC